MPRPDVARLGIAYRRIPILAIGRDVYLDTRLQLSKLETMFPSRPRLGAGAGAGDAERRAIERLLSRVVTDGGVFESAFQALPGSLPLLRDAAFARDRAEFSGGTMSLKPEERERARPEALLEMRDVFALLEETLLADGRAWLLGAAAAAGPSLADIEAAWAVLWVMAIPGALPEETFSAATFPRTYTWARRFREATARARAAMPVPGTLSGEEAAARITGAAPLDESGRDGGLGLNEADPVVQAQGLRMGDEVTVWPTDSGSRHKDTGRLVGLSGAEVVLDVAVPGPAGSAVRLHAPRHGFALRKGGLGQRDQMEQRL